MVELAPGDLVWVTPDPTVGSEQAGRRPALVVSGEQYLATIESLAIVVPVTTTNRHWPNHVRVIGGDLHRESWAMTEQPRAISRTRIAGSAGSADHRTLAEVRHWIADHLGLAR